MRSQLFRGTAILLCGLVAAGCEDVTGSSGISLTLGSQTLEVAQGASNTVSITVARNDFDGDVTLSASGLPSGVTADFTPGTLSGGATGSTLTLSASGAAATGDASVTITASGEDVDDATATLTLTVTEGGVFALEATPASVSVVRGSTANTTISIARDAGFTAGVTLSASGLPSGVTASFNPATVTGGSSTMTLTASGSATLGAATITITGASSGVASQSTNVALTVNAAGSTQQLTVDFCASDAPLWVAYQNEGGAWTRMTLDANHTVSAQITPKVSIALVWPGEDVEIIQTTAAELAPVNGVTCTEDSDVFKTLSGSVANASSHFVDIAMGWGYASLAPTDNTYTIEVPDGALDLVATRTPEASPTFTPDRFIIRRGLNLANGATIPTLDFGAAEAVAPTSHALTVTGGGSDDVYLDVAFVASVNSPNPTYVYLGSESDASGTTSFIGVPAASTAATDLHTLSVDASDPVTFETTRGGVAFFSDPANKTIALGAELAEPTISTVASSPYYRPRIQLAAGGYDGAVEFALYDPASGNELSVFISANFLASAPTTWDFTMPDFSGVSGWDNSWALPTSSGLEIDAEAYSDPLNFITEFGADNTIITWARWANYSFGAAPVATAERGQRKPRRAPRVTWHGVER